MASDLAGRGVAFEIVLERLEEKSGIRGASLSRRASACPKQRPQDARGARSRVSGSSRRQNSSRHTGTARFKILIAPYRDHRGEQQLLDACAVGEVGRSSTEPSEHDSTIYLA